MTTAAAEAPLTCTSWLWLVLELFCKSKELVNKCTEPGKINCSHPLKSFVSSVTDLFFFFIYLILYLLQGALSHSERPLYSLTIMMPTYIATIAAFRAIHYFVGILKTEHCLPLLRELFHFIKRILVLHE